MTILRIWYKIIYVTLQGKKIIIKEVFFMSVEKVFTIEQAKKIGEMLEVNWSKFNIEQFKMGLIVELEHGTIDSLTNVTDNDPLVTAKIALAHLKEYADYYTRLEKMEAEAKKYWENA